MRPAPSGRQPYHSRRSRRANPPYPLYSHPSSNGFISRKCSLWNSNNPSSRR